MRLILKFKLSAKTTRQSVGLFAVLFFFLFVCVDAYAQGSAKVTRSTVTLGAQNQNSAYGGFVDLLTGETYKLAEVKPHQHKIDLIYTWGSSTEINFMLPSSASLRSFGAPYRREVYNGWTQKNRGTLLSIEGNRENRRIFRRIKTNEQLHAAYNTALRAVPETPGYVKNQHGPGARIRLVQIGDYIVLRSRDRDVYAIGRVIDLDEGYTGYITLDMKVTTK